MADYRDCIWQGFHRKDGKKGIRNKVLVIYTVECASFVAKEIVRITNQSEVEVVGFSGCTDNEYAIRLLTSLIKHPNVGAVLVVGLGCEYIQPEWLSNIACEEGKETAWMFIQQEGGTRSTIEKGVKIVDEMHESLKKTPIVSMGWKDLIIGAECGGSDYTSGLAGNVVVGRFFDQIIEIEGTAVFEEIVEAIGLKALLISRARNQKVAEDIRFTYEKALDYCKLVGQYSISPGNFAGGLSTIEEKSMGAVIKSGSKPIEGILKVGNIPPKEGLWLLDSTPDPHWMQYGITNPNDNEGLMALIASGCHIVFLVTGRGSVVGSAVSPCIKITGNSDTFKKMFEDMDFDAGTVLSGKSSLDEIVKELGTLVAEVAKGMQTKSEMLGHKEYFIPYKYQNKYIRKECGVI